MPYKFKADKAKHNLNYYTTNKIKLLQIKKDKYHKNKITLNKLPK